MRLSSSDQREGWNQIHPLPRNFCNAFLHTDWSIWYFIVNFREGQVFLMPEIFRVCGFGRFGGSGRRSLTRRRVICSAQRQQRLHSGPVHQGIKIDNIFWTRNLAGCMYLCMMHSGKYWQFLAHYKARFFLKFGPKKLFFEFCRQIFLTFFNFRA